MKSYFPARLVSYFLLATFWAIALTNLDRFPSINSDEPWILSPGIKFFSTGIYGSDLFAGFYGMEHHYLEFLPFMSFVQGASSRVFGIGVFQMRFIPVVLGSLILATTFAVARELKNERAASVALALLLLWQWFPSGDHIRATGIPLIDIARIARYDILAACLGVAALYQFIRARVTEEPWRDFASGLGAGLAALTHAYGLFWIGALLSTTAIDHLLFSHRNDGKHAARFLLGALIPGVAWLAFIGMNWSDFVGQTMQNRASFDLLNPSFYRDNLNAEGDRYSSGFDPGRFGYWLLILAAPLAIVLLFARSIFLRDRRALWIAVPGGLIPILFALLIKSKLPNYLVTMAPLFAITLAWLFDSLWERRHRATSVAIAIILLTTAAQGARVIFQMQLRASHVQSAQHFFRDLDMAIPTNARVLGLPKYWLAVPDRVYRSFVLPFIMSSPSANAHPVSFASALEHIAPTIVLLDIEIAKVMAKHATSEGAQFRSFLRDHNARLLRELRDPEQNPFFIYALDESP